MEGEQVTTIGFYADIEACVRAGRNFLPKAFLRIDLGAIEEDLLHKLSRLIVSTRARSGSETWDQLECPDLRLDSMDQDGVVRALRAWEWPEPLPPIEYGWLIENHDDPAQTLYASFDQGLVMWTNDPNKACRFARREDAEQMAQGEDCDAVNEHQFVVTSEVTQ